jgi:hypothetical protein
MRFQVLKPRGRIHTQINIRRVGADRPEYRQGLTRANRSMMVSGLGMTHDEFVSLVDLLDFRHLVDRDKKDLAVANCVFLNQFFVHLLTPFLLFSYLAPLISIPIYRLIELCVKTLVMLAAAWPLRLFSSPLGSFYSRPEPVAPSELVN